MIWYHIYLSAFCIPFVMLTIAYAALLNADYRFHQRMIALVGEQVPFSKQPTHLESPALDWIIITTAIGGALVFAIELCMFTFGCEMTLHEGLQNVVAIFFGIGMYICNAKALCEHVFDKYPVVVFNGIRKVVSGETIRCYYRVLEIEK